jgi:dTDP-glucose 4,6-dehydratase
MAGIAVKYQGWPVLVTGAGGFIGSHLTERLAELGAHVRAFIRYNSPNSFGFLDKLPPHLTERVEIIPGDLRSHEGVEAAVSGVECVFHLGAMISIPYSYAHPEEVVATNVLGTLNVLQACRTHRVTRLVHTSTSEAYGTARYTPIDEKHPLQAQSPYAASKIAADMLVESFQRSYELSAVTLRPFNNYGPRQSARAVIPTIITQALSREKILLGSRDTTRDFLFVADTVEAFLAAGEASVSGEVINVGTGRETSIDEVARLIGTLLGRPLEITLDGARVRPAQSEVRRLVADAGKARRLLGWEARVPLEEGLQRTIKWIGESLSRYKVDLYNV